MYPVILQARSDAATDEIGRIPWGFLLFSRSAALLLGAVAWATNLLVAPCGAEKIAENAA